VATPRPRSDEERQLLFRAALKVMRVNGYAEAQIGDILAEAGLGTRAFYRHFSSKDDLVLALFEENATTTASRLEAKVAAAGSARDQLLAWIDEMLDLGYDGRRSARAQLFAASAVRLSSAEAERRILDQLHAPLVEVLRAGAASGEFHSRAPEQDAASIQALVWVFFESAVLGRPVMPRTEAREHVLRFCLPALGLASDPPV
jgi:AcrR family transcriptional regulator